ncbi:hypothetical protein KZ770_09980 [Escherichia coli]|nr:hypothetical protein [Escherichia coli]
MCTSEKEHLVEVIIQTTAVPLEAQIAADLAAGGGSSGGGGASGRW